MLRPVRVEFCCGHGLMMFPGRKECNIEFEDVAKTEIIHVCADKAIKNCTIEGEVVCSTIYETSKLFKGAA